MFTKIKEFAEKNNGKIALAISILTYFLFFGSILSNSEKAFWTSDIKNKFHPARTYLQKEITQNDRFPFWSEKVYAGFPIYADIENAYLHPYNILTSVLFDPFTAYKIIHLTMYLVGSLGMYYLFKNRGVGLLGYATGNLVFYFNFFVINHQIHQSMMLTLYTLPLSLYLLDKYFLTKNHKYTVFNIITLVSAFYWGHPQMLILYLAALFIYLTFLIDKETFSKKIVYMLFTGWFVFLLGLPQLIPTWELKTQSIRSFEVEKISAEEGSFNPLMFSTLLYPNLFLNTDSYQGNEINEEYSLTETYNYIGVSVFILFLFSLVFLKDTRIRKYVLVSFIVYLVLSYSRYIPFFSLDSVPLLNLFRYWNRSVVLFIFPVSLLVGGFVDQLLKGRYLTKDVNFRVFDYILGLPFILLILSLPSEDTRQLLEKIPFYLSQSYFLKEWLVLSLVVFVLLLVVYRYSKFKYINFIAVILVFVVFFDLWHLSKDMVNFRTDSVGELDYTYASKELDGKRIILEKGSVEYNETLYYDFWSLFGYSQFVEKKYLNKFLENNIESISRPDEDELDSSMYDFYSDLGVSSIVFDRETVTIQKDNLDLIANDIKGKYIVKKEGNIILSLESPVKTQVQTYVKNYPGWVVKVNEKSVDIDSETLFINFDVPAGSSTVTMKFVPNMFYLGIILSILGLCVSVFAIKTGYVKKRLNF